MGILRCVQVSGGPYDSGDVSSAYIFRDLDWVSAFSFFIIIYACGSSYVCVCVCVINVTPIALRRVYNRNFVNAIHFFEIVFEVIF